MFQKQILLNIYQNYQMGNIQHKNLKQRVTKIMYNYFMKKHDGIVQGFSIKKNEDSRLQKKRQDEEEQLKQSESDAQRRSIQDQIQQHESKINETTNEIQTIDLQLRNLPGYLQELHNITDLDELKAKANEIAYIYGLKLNKKLRSIDTIRVDTLRKL